MGRLTSGGRRGRRLPWFERVAAAIIATIVIATSVVHAQSASSSANSMTPSGIPSAESRSWVSRHPVLTGTLVGLGAGVAIGIATCKYPGSEGSCDRYTFPGNARMLGGLTIGGIGAGIGAGVGLVVSRVRR
jgi:hypothetical protein